MPSATIRSAGSPRSAPVLASLPPQTFGQSRAWRYQLAAAAARLGEDTRHWGAPIPRCTGEEMTLHLILRRAAVTDTEQAFAWPVEDDPRGWGDLFEYLFQDHDVLMLYDMRLDVAEDLAGGVDLAPGAVVRRVRRRVSDSRPHLVARRGEPNPVPPVSDTG